MVSTAILSVRDIYQINNCILFLSIAKNILKYILDLVIESGKVFISNTSYFQIISNKVYVEQSGINGYRINSKVNNQES